MRAAVLGWGAKAAARLAAALSGLQREPWRVFWEVNNTCVGLRRAREGGSHTQHASARGTRVGGGSHAP